MTSPNLFYSQTENKYYWLGSEECNRCHKDCGMKALLLWDYWKTTFLEKVFCFNCKSDILRAGGKYQEFKMVDISFKEILPIDALPLWVQRPSLSAFKGSTVFDVATMPLENVKNIDKTTLLSRQSIQGASIGLDLKSDFEDSDNKLIDSKDALELLDFHNNAEALDNRMILSDRDENILRLRK